MSHPYQKLSVAVLLIIAGLLFIGFSLTGNSHSDYLQKYGPVQEIDLTEPDTNDDSAMSTALPRDDRIRVAIAPVISPIKSFEVYESLVDYIGEKLNRTPIFLQRRTYAEVNDLVRFRQCDLAFVCTYAYVRGADEFGMELLAAPRVDGKLQYNSYIIVPKGSRADSLGDLEGRSFASADLMSTTGWLWPMLWLKENAKAPESFFSEHIITGSHDNSIFAVASGTVGGAAVDSIVYDQAVNDDPELGKKVKIIQTSPPFGMPPFVVPKQIDPALKESLLNILLNMHEDEQGREILANLKIDRFEMIADESYDSVREAVRVIEGEP